MKDIKKILGTLVVVLLAAIGYFKMGPSTGPAPGVTPAGLEQSAPNAATASKSEPLSSKTMMQGPDGLTDIGPTLERIRQGIRHSHRNDGSVFQNREGNLPGKPRGYYREYVHPTPGVRGPGAQRLVMGKEGEIYYTPDHYGTFVRVNP